MNNSNIYQWVLNALLYFYSVQIQVRKSKTFKGTIQEHIDEGVKTVEKPSIIILVQYQNIFSKLLFNRKLD